MYAKLNTVFVYIVHIHDESERWTFTLFYHINFRKIYAAIAIKQNTKILPSIRMLVWSYSGHVCVCLLYSTTSTQKVAALTSVSPCSEKLEG